MKYQYGVEYETNGEKPDLGDDVCVQARSGGVWLDDAPVKSWRWSTIDKFRIVDERFKPKDDESNWFERGELPPVGTGCEYYSGEMSEYRKCTVATKWGKGVIVVDYEDDACEISYLHNLRPIQSELDKLVEQAVQVMRYSEDEVLSQKGMALALIGAGWRPKGD